MDKIIVTGGYALKGDVTVGGAKNAALPIIVSSLLTDGVNRYENVPRLMDITSINRLLDDLGCCVKRNGNTIEIDTAGFNKSEASYDLVRKMRASILVLGPILARMKKAKVSLPGGCAIGARPINLHLKGLEAMGASIELEHGYVNAKVKKLHGAEIYFDVVSVGATENLMMAASLAEGETILRNAAREPEISALADTLRKMGANIEGDGTSVIKIIGSKTLMPVNTRIIPDRIEAGTFMVAAALTNGDITVNDCEPEHMAGIMNKLMMTGASIEKSPTSVRVKGNGPIQSVDFRTLPYPGFPTDMQAQFMALMTIADGTSVITETIFENRFIHVQELKRMGANISLSGVNTATVSGVSTLSGAPVMASDLRASASLILAGLVATGKTEVNRVYHLDRGYEKIEEKFKNLGAEIIRVKA